MLYKTSLSNVRRLKSSCLSLLDAVFHIVGFVGGFWGEGMAKYLAYDQPIDPKLGHVIVFLL